MSLINEALKQAEQEKLRTPRQWHAPVGLEPVRAPAPPQRSRRELVALVALVVLVAGLAGWSAIKAHGSDAQQPPPVAAEQTPVPASLDAISALAAKAEAAYLRSMKPPREYRPVPRTLRSPTPKPAVLPRLRQTVPPRPVAPARRAAPVRYTAPPLRAAHVDRPRIKDLAEVPARGALAPAAFRNIDPGGFKLTGIMEGPDEAVAIINGYPVRLGEAIGQARLVKIGRYSVVLEVHGYRITVRM